MSAIYRAEYARIFGERARRPVLCSCEWKLPMYWKEFVGGRAPVVRAQCAYCRGEISPPTVPRTS